MLKVSVEEGVTCYCDAVRVEQVVWNLLGNAVKFTPAGGHVSVTLAAVEDKAELTVVDSGIGISPAFLPKIFELFTQGETSDVVGSRRVGLGIGLSLVRELVKAHGGTVDAKSAGPGQGATFVVRLPLAAGSFEYSDSRAAITPLPQRFLMIDDDRDSLLAFAALLEIEGTLVTVASSANDVLRLLEEGEYDVLLSDIEMPGMTGLELIEKVRSLPLRRRLRCIAVSGFGREVDVRNALNAGFDAHVAKPVSLDRLRTALQKIS